MRTMSSSDRHRPTMGVGSPARRPIVVQSTRSATSSAPVPGRTDDGPSCSRCRVEPQRSPNRTTQRDVPASTIDLPDGLAMTTTLP
jgi:hypothetical protein